MKVRVLQGKLGFYGERRRREGEVFDMTEQSVFPVDDDGKACVDKKGRPKVCPWVEAVNPKDMEKLMASRGFKVEAKPKPKPTPAEEKNDGDAPGGEDDGAPL